MARPQVGRAAEAISETDSSTLRQGGVPPISFQSSTTRALTNSMAVANWPASTSTQPEETRHR